MRGEITFELVLLAVIAASYGHDWIPIRDIKRLTLYKGRMTAGQRAPPMAQLKCKGGDACSYFVPEVVSCKNVGLDDRGEVQWKCEAQMEDSFRFGETKVSCEGYGYRGDHNVLKGSCGVFYTLHLTEKGKQKYLHRQHKSQRHTPAQTQVRPPSSLQRVPPRPQVRRAPVRQRNSRKSHMHPQGRSTGLWRFFVGDSPLIQSVIATLMAIAVVSIIVFVIMHPPSLNTLGVVSAVVAIWFAIGRFLDSRDRAHVGPSISGYPEPNNQGTSTYFSDSDDESNNNNQVTSSIWEPNYTSTSSGSGSSSGWGSSSSSGWGDSSSWGFSSSSNNDSSTYKSTGYGGTELR